MMSSCASADWFTQASSDGGSAESEHTAVAVRPRRAPACRLARMLTPPARRRMAPLKAAVPMLAPLAPFLRACCMCPPLWNDPLGAEPGEQLQDARLAVMHLGEALGPIESDRGSSSLASPHFPRRTGSRF